MNTLHVYALYYIGYTYIDQMACNHCRLNSQIRVPRVCFASDNNWRNSVDTANTSHRWCRN